MYRFKLSLKIDKNRPLNIILKIELSILIIGLYKLILKTIASSLLRTSKTLLIVSLIEY